MDVYSYGFLVYVTTWNLLVLNYQVENGLYKMEFFHPMQPKEWVSFCFMHTCFTLIGIGFIWHPLLLGPF